MITIKKHTIKQELGAFSKAQVAAFVGGLIDYGIMILLTEIFNIYYIFSIIAGGITGAFTNYAINRKWSFKTTGTMYKELIKFTLVALGSIVLKCGGTYVLTEFIGFDYRFSRLIVDAIVSLGFNYTLHRLWVFKN